MLELSENGTEVGKLSKNGTKIQKLTEFRTCYVFK